MPLINAVPFTWFKAPNGRQSPDSIFVGDAEFAQWLKIKELGLRMTVEMLSNGRISMCVEDPKLGDFDCIVCANGPAVPGALSKMLFRFDPAAVPAWLEEMS